MSEFDWRSPEAYASLQSAEATDFAWECLRRNLDYREDYRSLQRGGSPAALSEEKFRERWGLSFSQLTPRQPFDTQAIFWAPEVLPTVLPAGVRSSIDACRYEFDLTKLTGAELRRASDGWHAVVRLGGTTHRLWLREPPTEATLLILELPLDAEFDVRSRAAHRLWSALGGRRPGPPLPALSAQRRQRITLAIRALDGRAEGNSYRAIAEALFGKSRIPHHAWKTHDLRNRTIRLVQSGLALMRGSYRALLQRSRRKQ